MDALTKIVLVAALAIASIGCRSNQMSEPHGHQKAEPCFRTPGCGAQTSKGSDTADTVERLLRSVAVEDVSFISDATSRGGIAFKRGVPSDEPIGLGAVILAPEHGSIQTLIRIGVPALPALLDHLSDFSKTSSQPTWRDTPWACAYVRLEAWYDAHNRAQQLDRITRFREAFKTDPAQEFQVSIADVCYYVIGQIVNRPYFPLQFASKTGIAVETPQRNPELIQDLRTKWSKLDAASHLAHLKEDLAPGQDFAVRANAYARLIVFYPEQFDVLVAGAITSEQDIVRLRRFVSSLDLEKDPSINDSIVKRLQLIGSGPYDEDAMLLGLACTDQLIRRKAGGQTARAFLEGALAQYPDSTAIAERLSAISP